jgi:ATP-dependent RNA helicase RhlE
MTLTSLGLRRELCVFDTPTPVQTAVVPRILAGEDVTAVAETGSGKTAAYGLPLLQCLDVSDDAPPRGLIVAPTRELANQIGTRLSDFGGPLGLRVSVLTGGTDLDRQTRYLAASPDLVVGTPGRLADHVRRGSLHLASLQHLVLDEADQLLDDGFADALLQLADGIGVRQTLLFSATLPPALDRFVHRLCRSPHRVRLDDRPPGTLVQQVYYVSNNDRLALLAHLIAESRRTVVFTRTKKAADAAAAYLDRAGCGVAVLHADRSQADRNAALTAFAADDVALLICTDVAARGLDLPDIRHVVNLGMPYAPETYVHRVGRTARAGRNGTASSLCTPEDGGRLRDIERLIGVPLAPVLDQPFNDFSAIPNPRDTATSKKRGKPGRRRR